MNVHVNDAPRIGLLAQQRENTLEQIDCALDRGDRRAFHVWAGRYRDITVKLERTLLTIATAKE